MITKCSTPSCAACRKVSMMLQKLNVEVKEIDVTEDIDFVKENDIMSLPTLINEKGDKLTGIPTLSELKTFCGVE